MAYLSKHLSFDAIWDADTKSTHVAIFVMGEDEDAIELRSDNIDDLPDYFGEADAENFWTTEQPVARVVRDMLAMGYTYVAREGHGTDDEAEEPASYLDTMQVFANLTPREARMLTALLLDEMVQSLPGGGDWRLTDNQERAYWELVDRLKGTPAVQSGDLTEDVADFHRAMDMPVLYTPQFVPSRAELRAKLIREEAKETCDAIEAGDMTQIADGIVDTIYVCVGAALEFGIPVRDVWDIVHKANMAKVDPATGKVIKREDGKVLKPEGWVAPDDTIEALLASYA